MFTSPNDVIAFGLRSSHNRFRSFVDDLKPHEFTAQPVPGVNSVSWLLGHLALTDRRMLGLLGADVPPLPDGFAERFQTTRKPAELQSGLGDPVELVAVYDAHRTRLIEAVGRAGLETLNQPLPNPHPLFATVGEAVAFMAVHLGLHGGQVSVIRRALGYPPVA